jgi:hypothetical protein
MSKAHRFSIALAILGPGLLALGGCNKEDKSSQSASQTAETKASAPAAPGPGLKSAEPNSFEEVAAQLDRGGSLYFYLSTEQWLAGLSEHLLKLRDLVLSSTPAKQFDPAAREKAERVFSIVTDLVKKSGLEEITGVGASSIALEPGLHRNKVFVHHYKGKDTGFLWSAFGKAPHRLTALDLLPADTALASFADVDLAQLVGVVRQEIEQSGIAEAKQGLDMVLLKFSAATGMSLDEVLQSLGGNMGIILTLDVSKKITVPVGGDGQTIPAPRIALVWQVKDDRIFKQVEKAIAPLPGLVQVTEPDLRMRTMPLPLPIMEVRPTAAQWGNYLIVASDDKLIRDIIAAQKDGKGLKATPEFVRQSAGMPEEGNAFQIVTQLFADTWTRFQSGMMKNQPGMTQEQLAMMQKLLSFQNPSATYSVSSHIENGWLMVSKSNHGASRLIAAAVVAPLAIAAGVALPAFMKARDHAKATKSLAQAKQIGMGCKMYAGDNDGKFPPTLDALVPDYVPDAKTFISPFAPEIPMGYDYTAGLTDQSPPDKVLIEDKFASREHQRVVVHVDGSGEVTHQP